MKRGKKTCNTLKTIRKQIADANNIHYEPRECKHEGDCMGTCPACEAEVRYLERELDLRRKLGKAVAVVGISAGLAGLTACGSKKAVTNDDMQLQGDVIPPPVLAGIPVLPPVMPIVADVDTTEVTVTTDDEKLFGDIHDQMAEFPGGNAGLQQYIAENLRYPQNVEGCISGRVVVTMIINEDGTVSDAKVVKSSDTQLDAEALRVISEMPKWKPATRNGKYTKVRYTIPVKFSLE